MLISVVIPSFNRGDRLVRALHSVLAQTHAELELVVVDDGSTDATPELLKDIKDRRVRVISQANRGVSAARNRGIAKARGAMIALLDSDDCWMPDKLDRQLRFMREGEWEISQTEELWIRQGRRVNPRQKHVKHGGWIFEPSLALCLVSPSCVMFSRRCWEVVGPFDENLPACEDYDLWLRCSLKYPIGLVPQALVKKIGGHPDQLSRKIIGLDIYRIYSLVKVGQTTGLPTDKRRALLKNLELRANRYIQGCLKRDKPEEAQRIRELIATLLGNRVS